MYMDSESLLTGEQVNKGHNQGYKKYLYAAIGAAAVMVGAAALHTCEPKIATAAQSTNLLQSQDRFEEFANDDLEEEFLDEETNEALDDEIAEADDLDDDMTELGFFSKKKVGKVDFSRNFYKYAMGSSRRTADIAI